MSEQNDTTTPAESTPAPATTPATDSTDTTDSVPAAPAGAPGGPPAELEPGEAPAASGQPVLDSPLPGPAVPAEPAELPGADELLSGEDSGAAAEPADVPEPAEVPEPADVSDVVEPAPNAPDPEEVTRRKVEIVVEAEALAGVPDTHDDGRAPDDRALTEQLRTLDERWRAAGSAGPAEAELRRRFQAARTTYTAARSHRAEVRAVERARAAETKRALLVEAFALAQLAQGTTLSQLAGKRLDDDVAQAAPAPVSAPVAADVTEVTEVTETDDATVNPVEEIAVAEQPDTGADQVAPTVAEGESDETAEETPLAEETRPAEETPPAEETRPTEEDSASAVPDPLPEAGPEVAAGPTVDIGALAKRARELQAEWGGAGFAGREVDNELQPLFRRYLQVVFDKSRKDASGKIAGRRDLVSTARALAAQAADASPQQVQRLVRDAKALQQTWKDGEAAPRTVETGAWRQFSGALREVFAARERLAVGARAEREDIIAKAIALGGGRDPMRAVRDLGPLLRRWREAGAVPTPVYEELKAKLDIAANGIRERADSERSRRDAEQSKQEGERAKNASKILREAERSSRNRPQRDRPAGAAQQGALAAALAEAFGRAERVADEVRKLEATVVDLRERLQRAETGALQVDTAVRVGTGQGFSVRSAADPGAVNPVRLRAELEQAETALTRRRADLAELTSSARGLGLAG